VTLLAVAAVAAVLLWMQPPREPATPVPQAPAETSVAVIPFDALGESAEQQAWFAEGITLDLITELSRIPDLLVIAPSTSFGYRESGEDDGTIARALGVEYLIRGAVQRFKERIRIHVRLIEADGGRTLWAERFAGDTESLFRIQDEVVAGIADTLPVRLALSRQSPAPTGATRSIAAYEEFLRGRERYGRLTPEDNRAARRHFERAIELDPGFARAHAGLALAWSRLAIDGWSDDPQAALSRAAELADAAAAIDPGIPQIHFVRAQVALFSGRHTEAAAAAETAIGIDPNYADAYALLAWILNYAGRPDQAESSLREALRRNPRGSASYRQIAGEIHFARGQYEEAARDFEAALQRNPAHTRARLWLAATLSRLGRPEEAEWEVQELLAIDPDFALSRLLMAFPLKDTRAREVLFDELARLELPD
jgi:adenylate cyclase